MPRLIVAVASIVALVSFIVGMIDSDQLETTVPIVGVCYAIWAVWSVLLGVGLLKASTPANG